MKIGILSHRGSNNRQNNKKKEKKVMRRLKKVNLRKDHQNANIIQTSHRFRMK